MNPKTMQHMKKENRRKPSVFAGFLAGAEGLSLACRLGCCSLVGSAQHRPRREPRPVRSRAPLALAHPSARGFGVDVEERKRERGRGGVARFLLQDENVRCWFGATGNFRGQNRRKRAENPPKSRKYIDRNRHRPYNKKCRETPGGVCCRQAVSHSLFTLCRKGVMRMGHKRGTKALRFVVCLVIVLAVADIVKIS